MRQARMSDDQTPYLNEHIKFIAVNAPRGKVVRELQILVITEI